jgi:hypothetical protein
MNILNKIKIILYVIISIIIIILFFGVITNFKFKFLNNLLKWECIDDNKCQLSNYGTFNTENECKKKCTINNNLQCKYNNECPSILNCKNNICVFNNNDDKNRFLKYLTAIYPTLDNYSFLTNLEIYNFFKLLNFYWVSYHTNIDNLLHLIESDFPNNVYCGFGYSSTAVKDILCGPVNPPGYNDDFFQKYSPIWPSYPNYCTPSDTTKCCCKIGSLSKFPSINSLYTIVFMFRDIEVLRNGYDNTNLLNNSILFDPIYLYNIGKLNVVNSISFLPLIKNGIDNSGINLSYKCCDKSNTYDFTKQGPGYSSNSNVEISRDRGSGDSPNAFYYVSSGTGNFLNTGTTLRAINKIHAILLLIRRAGELNFGSLRTYLFSNYTNTKKIIKLKDTSIFNSFIMTPQLFLLEYMSLTKYKYGMNHPASDIQSENINGFANNEATKLLSSFPWPFKENGSGWNINGTQHTGLPYSFYTVSFTTLLQWFFKLNNSILPDITDYINNWSNWSFNDVNILGKFMDAITVPYFSDWKLNFCFNRIADSEQADAIFYQLINPIKSEIKGNALTVDPLDINGNSWNGIINLDNKFINTICFCIQPNSSGLWAYEMTDFRINIKSANCLSNNESDPNTCQEQYWNQYTNLFMHTGNPLTKIFNTCIPHYCENSNEWCVTSPDPKHTLAGQWKVFTCFNPKKLL